MTNVVYQLCTKSVPDAMNPFASLTITYTVAALTSAAVYFTITKGGNLLSEWRMTNWASVVLGIGIVGLEAGYIYAFKAGWQISRVQIVQACFVAVILIIIGYLLYHEALTPNKIIGILICLIGLAVINWNA